MRIARLLTPAGPVSGRYEDGVVHADDGTYEVGVDGRLLPPCAPTALYCVGRNYAAKIDQMDYDVPDEPDFFVKPPASLLAHGQPIRYPRFASELAYAGELAAVIGERCRPRSPAAAEDAVLGFTVMNDLDAVDQERRTARKAFDGSAPLGPWIETDVDPTNLDMYTDVGGERRQEASTGQMLFSAYEAVAFLAGRFTFRPGDVVAFGSPANPGLLEPGDVVEITYEGVGTLRNRVVDPE